MAGVKSGSRVLDVAAGAGGQTLAAARRVGSDGYVLATDISSNILALAAEDARQAGLTNIETRVLDGENLDVEPGTFDVVISRVALIYFPDQQAALKGMTAPSNLVAKWPLLSTPQRRTTNSFPALFPLSAAALNYHLPFQDNQGHSAWEILAFWKRYSRKRDFIAHRARLYPRHFGWPRQPNVSASSMSHLVLYIRCYPVYPMKMSGRMSGLKSSRNSSSMRWLANLPDRANSLLALA